MCIICVDFEKGKLTTKEARRALGELASGLDKRHVEELEAVLARAEEAPPQGGAPPIP
jgi:hypothetical protein